MCRRHARELWRDGTLEVDDRRIELALDRILIRDDRFASQCEVCLDPIWPPLVSLAFVVNSSTP